MKEYISVRYAYYLFMPDQNPLWVTSVRFPRRHWPLFIVQILFLHKTNQLYNQPKRTRFLTGQRSHVHNTKQYFPGPSFLNHICWCCYNDSKPSWVLGQWEKIKINIEGRSKSWVLCSWIVLLGWELALILYLSPFSQRLRSPGIDSACLCNQAGQYDE